MFTRVVELIMSLSLSDKAETGAAIGPIVKEEVLHEWLEVELLHPRWCGS